jgi:hypothetical protein
MRQFGVAYAGYYNQRHQRSSICIRAVQTIVVEVMRICWSSR